MIARQPKAVFTDFSNKGIPVFVVVMEVYLNVGDAETHNFGKAVEEIATVLLLGVEEAVLWTLTCVIPGRFVGDLRPLVTPGRHAFERCCN